MRVRSGGGEHHVVYVALKWLRVGGRSMGATWGAPIYVKRNAVGE